MLIHEEKERIREVNCIMKYLNAFLHSIINLVCNNKQLTKS